MTAQAAPIPVRSSSPFDQAALLRLVGGHAPRTHNPGWEWELILTACDDALARFAGSATGTRARIAVGEALWWVACANEFLRTRVSTSTSKQYTADLVTTDSGRCLAGLVLLRNRMGHQLAVGMYETVADEKQLELKIVHEDGSVETDIVTVRAEAKRRLDLQGGLVLGAYHFPPFEELPEPDELHLRGYPDSQDAYKSAVAGHLVGETLTYAIRCLRATLQFDRDGTKVHARLNRAGVVP